MRLAIVIVFTLLSGCAKRGADAPVCAHTGDVITMKVDGRKGMVMYRTMGGMYAVRFSLSGDSRRAYDVQQVSCYEFERGVE